MRIDDLGHFEFARGDRAAHTAQQQLQHVARPTGRDTFGLLVADGLAMQEEALVASIDRNLGHRRRFMKGSSAASAPTTPH